jgi:hypothetical protein
VENFEKVQPPQLLEKQPGKTYYPWLQMQDDRLTGFGAKTKDPSGGTAGRVKPYGRLGWMGARAEYSLNGEEIITPRYWSRQALPTFKAGLRIFWPRRPAFCGV